MLCSRELSRQHTPSQSRELSVQCSRRYLCWGCTCQGMELNFTLGCCMLATTQVDMRIAETKKDTYEFKRDIIIGAENVRTGKIVAEKMIK